MSATAEKTSLYKKSSTNPDALPPNNIEAEEAVLGAILKQPSVMNKIVEMLSAEAFYLPAHRIIYGALKNLYDNNENIDIISVSENLNYSGKLESIGGRAYINDLLTNTVTTVNVKYYAKLIQESAIKRSLISAGSEIVSSGYEKQISVDEALDSAEKLIFDISSQKSSSEMVHVKDIVMDTYEKIQYNYEHKGELTGVPTSFYDLDLMTNGLQKSDLIILAARPSMGKTALALNIAQNIALKSKVPVAIFSLEMSKQQLMQRMLCAESEVDAQRLKTGDLHSKDWEKIASAMNAFAQAPIYVDDTSGCTITDLRAKCRRLKMKEKNLGLIVIDYLQLMEGIGKEDRLQQISAISRGLKILAKDLDVPVLALSQLSRAVEQRTGNKPQLSDLRDSGAIEQDADIVMFIYREDYYKQTEGSEEESNAPKAANGESEIIIAKHRNGPVGSIKLLFQGNITKFKNPISTNVF
ncbi:replicative DNA helicase [bacterium]|nr:replicative DNA helicase [bacterium]